MRSKAIGIVIALAISLAGLGAAGHHHFKQDFYIFCNASCGFIIGAEVTVSWVANGQSGSQTGETQRPHGNVSFRVPGEADYLHVEVSVDGWEPWEGDVFLNGRPNVGGQGFWIGLNPVQPGAPTR